MPSARTRAVSRAVCLAVIAGHGCIEQSSQSEPVDAAPIDRGADGPVDGALDRGDRDGPPNPDARLDPGPDDSVDAAPDPGPDDSVDAAPDAGPIDPTIPPSHAQVAVSRRGEALVFVYPDPAGRLVAVELPPGAAAPGEPRALAPLDVTPTRVVAAAADDGRWVAYGSPDAPIALLDLDAPDAAPRVLGELYGPPLVAPTGAGVLVIGRAADGRLAWQRATAAGLEPPVVDPFDRGLPDDAASIATGVVLHFGEVGQCLHIADDGATARSFVCPTGRGRLLTAGDRSLLAHAYTFGQTRQLGVSPLFGPGEPFRVAVLADDDDGTLFGRVGAEAPVIGLDVARQALDASIATPDGIWKTVETWDPDAPPFDRTRALVRRSSDGPPAELVALDFRLDGRPAIRIFELQPAFVGDPPYAIPDHEGCQPRPEVCDGVDQDCDGRVDDGRCCPGAGIEARWQTRDPVARVEGGGPALLIADPDRSGYRVLYRFADSHRWEGRHLNVLQDLDGDAVSLGVTIDDAIDGRFLLAAQGVTALVARHVVDGAPGPWSLFMAHPTRAPDEAPPPRVALGCDAVLAAATLSTDGPDGQPDGERFVVVCAARIVIVSAAPGAALEVYPVEGLEMPPLAWATLSPVERGELGLLVGHRIPGEGAWSVRALVIEDAPRPAIRPGFLPPALELLGPDDPMWPIHPHPVPTRPSIQIVDDRRARLAFGARDDQGRRATTWRRVLFAPEVQAVRVSDVVFAVLGAGPVSGADGAEATGWWAADVLGNDRRYGLWSTDPMLTLEGGSIWAAANDTRWLDARIDAADHALAVVTPLDDTDRAWRFRTFGVDCRPPAR